MAEISREWRKVCNLENNAFFRNQVSAIRQEFVEDLHMIKILNIRSFVFRWNPTHFLTGIIRKFSYWPGQSSDVVFSGTVSSTVFSSETSFKSENKALKAHYYGSKRQKQNMAHSSFENHHARLSIISVISDFKINVKILILTEQLYEKKTAKNRDITRLSWADRCVYI